MVMSSLLLALLNAAAADPVLPEPVLLDLPGDPARSAFLVLLAEGQPALVAPESTLTREDPLRLSWADTEKVVLKLKPGVPDASSPSCAPAGEPLGSRRAPPRLAKSALEVAPGDPDPLEHVWLISRSEDGRRVHPATVERIDGGTLTYVLQKPVPLIASPGAPVVDVLGRVVGVHLRTETLPSGRTVGHACGQAATRAALGNP